MAGYKDKEKGKEYKEKQKEYQRKYYLGKNKKPTDHEMFLLREKYRAQRALGNTSREILEPRKIIEGKNVTKSM